MPDQPKAVDDRPWSFDEVLQLELEQIAVRRKRLGEAKPTMTAETSALCLSGGGVRSASFCLGVVRGLARKRVLKNFDYLSTVSGGGFTGAFLSRWVKEDGYEKVELQLADDLEFARPNAPLSHIRSYIAYLTPRIGLFSLDSISGAGMFVRNLIVNWLIIIPFLMAALALILALQAAFQWLALLPDSRLPFSVLMLSGVTLCGYAISYALFRRPGLSTSQKDLPFESLVRNYSMPVFWGSFAIAAAIVVAKANSVIYHAFNLIILLLCLLGLALSQAMAAIQRKDFKTRGELFKHVTRIVRALMLQCAAFIFVGVLLLDQLLTLFVPAQAVVEFGPVKPVIEADTMANVYFILGPLIFTLTLYLSEVIFVAARGNPKSGNFEREWLARSTGALFGFPLGWAFLTYSVIYGPNLVSEVATGLLGTGAGIADTVGLTTISGFILALLSRRRDAVALIKQGKETWTQIGARWLLAIVMPVFIFLLIVLLTSLTQHLGYRLFDLISYNSIWTFLVVAASLLLIGYLFDVMIPTNVFTLHQIYRNRLVRSFVGAANPERTAGDMKPGFLNYFLGDNVDMCALSETKNSKHVPPQLHIINMALNVPGSADIALQERKALPFSATAVAIGSRSLRPKANAPDPEKPLRMQLGSYRPAAEYTNSNNLPFSLGSAVAISGAAVNPNMGYHSSPALSVLLTLFNLRLGIWLGNPSLIGDESYKRDGPTTNISTLFIEAMGYADEHRKFLHLSDGGHFDNLGLYEVLARRCRLIVVADAGCDLQTGLSDLGIAQRLAKLDLGVEITFEKDSMQNIRDDKSRVARGTIHYAATAEAEASEGVIIYIKPRVLAGDSAIISSYRTKAQEFPHEPTSDQWFTESQFAAYLALGETAAAAIPDEALAMLRPRPPSSRKSRPKGRMP